MLPELQEPIASSVALKDDVYFVERVHVFHTERRLTLGMQWLVVSYKNRQHLAMQKNFACTFCKKKHFQNCYDFFWLWFLAV